MEELPTIKLSEFVLWLLRRRRRMRVTGNSMLPLLKPGDEVLIDPYAYQAASPQPGDVVVTQHPYQINLRLIKRVSSVVAENRYMLFGDNPAESTDSRVFGAVPLEKILGKVTSRFS